MTVRACLVAIAMIVPGTVAVAQGDDPAAGTRLANGSIHLPVSQDCDLPPADTAEKVVLIAAYEGRDYASVTVAGQAGPTTYGLVDIQTQQPVYLILTSMESMVWQVKGPVDRVVATTRGGNGGEGVGIVGVDPGAIVFLSEDCPLAASFEAYRGGPSAVVAANAIAAMVGVSHFAYGGDYTAPWTVVGEDEVVTHEALPGQQVRRRSAMRIVEVDPAAVVSSHPAEAYLAYPGETGVALLREDGAIAAAQPRDFAAWMAGYLARPDVPAGFAEEGARRERIEGFYIVRTARHLPVPMPWYNLYVWLVPPGVSVPSDASGEQCVFIMDGFEYLGPETCPALLATQ